MIPFFLASLFTPLAFASGIDAFDARNTADYHVIFDLEAHGTMDLVDGYGAYVQVFEKSDTQWIRYCENFDGKNMSGRPNLKRSRFKLLPFGQVDDTAYHCRDFTLADLALGQPLIQLGEKTFFAMKSAAWSQKDGGEILFQFAKKLPLLGSPTYKTLRIRATRSSSALDYVVETIVPRTGVLPFHFYLFGVSGSGLGLPNGIASITLDPTERTEKKIDLDILEGPIQLRGTGKSSSAAPNSWPKTNP